MFILKDVQCIDNSVPKMHLLCNYIIYNYIAGLRLFVVKKNLLIEMIHISTLTLFLIVDWCLGLLRRVQQNQH